MEELDKTDGMYAGECLNEAMVGTALNQNQKMPQEQCRISLREEIESRTYRAQDAARERSKLSRLSGLIDKNPAIFEMISLMRDLRLI